ncbi:YpjP family protein [Alkalihalobacillus sp. MEB130]|uniref:YpjP family protein n=1 Tax=Alkalihalobacillus sp. MEB130 TaxID=2976704 RepID=UPI0028DDBB64|nr:YpjP family protein [Alkalihalobacillus sp. MEB130]MDT8859938.1 YpjP family protein [Alkalihalobacillus sp. MEB130]
MFRQMKRGLVISSALLSFGLFVPSIDVVREVQAEEPQKTQGESNENPFIYEVNEDSYDLFGEVLPAKTDHYIHRNASSADVLNDFIMKQAMEQSLLKFGTVISEKIHSPFQNIIFPKLDTVVRETTSTLSDQEWEQLKISTSPSSGLGEKIFHLYNETSGEDIFRFHVRRDQPPKQGYTFNFHYHTYLDQHEKHHTIGNIEWGKDMPPRWSNYDRVYS